MNKIAKSSLNVGHGLAFKDGPKAPKLNFKPPYPILEVISLYYEGEAYLNGKYPHIEISIEAEVKLEDSLDGVAFNKKMKIKDEADILAKEDEVGEGYIYEGSDIDLDELSILMLHSALPLRVRRPNAPKSNDDVVYRYSEDE